MTEDDFAQHEKSKKHQNKFKAKTFEELKEHGSFEKLLIAKNLLSKRRTPLHKIKFFLYSMIFNQMFNN